MANKKKPKTRLERVDARVWNEVKTIMPNASSADISRILYDTSLLKFEKGIRDWNRKWSVDFSVKPKKKQKR